MANIRNTFHLGIINSDDNPRLVKNGEVTDASHVMFGGVGNDGVASRFNSAAEITAVTDVMPPNVNYYELIGETAFINKMYLFYLTDVKDVIIEYDMKEDYAELVAFSNKLGFNIQSQQYVSADVVDSKYLYYTIGGDADGLVAETSPKRFNIEKAKANPTTYFDTIDINNILPRPNAPVLTHVLGATTKARGNFMVAVRIKTNDNEWSPLGYKSNSVTIIDDSNIISVSYSYDVYVLHIDSIKEIEFYLIEDKTNTIKLIRRFDKDTSNNYNFTFIANEYQGVLDVDSANIINYETPIKTAEQSLLNSRLIYHNSQLELPEFADNKKEIPFTLGYFKMADTSFNQQANIGYLVHDSSGKLDVTSTNRNIRATIYNGDNSFSETIESISGDYYTDILRDRINNSNSIKVDSVKPLTDDTFFEGLIIENKNDIRVKISYVEEKGSTEMYTGGGNIELTDPTTPPTTSGVKFGLVIYGATQPNQPCCILHYPTFDGGANYTTVLQQQLRNLGHASATVIRSNNKTIINNIVSPFPFLYLSIEKIVVDVSDKKTVIIKDADAKFSLDNTKYTISASIPDEYINLFSVSFNGGVDYINNLQTALRTQTGFTTVTVSTSDGDVFINNIDNSIGEVVIDITNKDPNNQGLMPFNSYNIANVFYDEYGRNIGATNVTPMGNIFDPKRGIGVNFSTKQTGVITPPSWAKYYSIAITMPNINYEYYKVLPKVDLTVGAATREIYPLDNLGLSTSFLKSLNQEQTLTLYRDREERPDYDRPTPEHRRDITSARPRRTRDGLEIEFTYGDKPKSTTSANPVTSSEVTIKYVKYT